MAVAVKKTIGPRASGKTTSSATVTLKQIAAQRAERQDLSKKQTEAILADPGGPHRPSPEERRPAAPDPSRHPASSSSCSAHGTQSSHRRGHPDQGQQEDRLSPRLGAEGFHLTELTLLCGFDW
jgi:hypothetical protein